MATADGVFDEDERRAFEHVVVAACGGSATRPAGQPWDDPERRPSHAVRCNALKREGLREEIRRVCRRRQLTRKIRTLFRGLLKLVA